MAVFGPLTLIALVVGGAVILGRKDKWTAERELWLLSFLLPPLVVILGQDIISRAHANWAATAYPAAAVLLASWIDRALGRETSRIKMGPWIKIGVALNAVVGVLFAISWVAPSLGDAVGGTNAYKRVRGWDQTAQELNAIAVKNNASVVMFDEREIWHGVDYYGRNIKTLPPIRAWQRGDTPRSHAEEAGKMRPGEDSRVLVASYVAWFRPQIRAHLAHIGAPLIGDPLYGKFRGLKLAGTGEAVEAAKDAARDFPRQALHAAIGKRPVRLLAGEQVARWPARSPVGAEFFQ